MGLDIYVGTLSRYFSGDWKGVVQQAAEAQGIPFEVIRTGSAGEAPIDPDEIRNTVLVWRRAVAANFKASEADPEPWDESPSAPYFTDKPGWEGYNSLFLLAIYAMYPGRLLPDGLVEDLKTDPVFRAYSDLEPKGLRGAFAKTLGPPPQPMSIDQITHAELWLPIRFDTVVMIGGPPTRPGGCGIEPLPLGSVE
jgi:hypothetical protein